jgi:hypothetical protein
MVGVFDWVGAVGAGDEHFAFSGAVAGEGDLFAVG